VATAAMSLAPRALAERVRAVLRLNDPPSRIALALAVGVFIGCTPFYGLQTLLSLGLAALFHLNKAATVTGESLRRKAAGQLGDEGVEGARAVADEIERVLVGMSSEPIQLARERADAVYYVLNVSVRPNDPEEADALALYVAVREIHDERLRRG